MKLIFILNNMFVNEQPNLEVVVVAYKKQAQYYVYKTRYITRSAKFVIYSPKTLYTNSSVNYSLCQIEKRMVLGQTQPPGWINPTLETLPKFSAIKHQITSYFNILNSLKTHHFAAIFISFQTLFTLGDIPYPSNLSVVFPL